MAATLAGVCQVPLTAVWLLFELTQDYRIVIPLLGAVGTSSWITSGKSRRRELTNTNKPKDADTLTASKNASNDTSICEIESSVCIDYFDDVTELVNQITVS
ncbi:hypothetical protein Leryth_027369, partial [Lithospermum erythrorhizon]